ncbi:MAG TPA: SDR family oxidoreductase [Kaistia sp.]|nr:SDR family oxidoreductase [Kaistia sp.]
MSESKTEAAGTILLIGASRGLGYAMAAELLRRGWKVIGTVRGSRRTLLHALADAYPDRVEIEQLDVNDPEQVEALRSRLSGRSVEILFVNAGTANTDQDETIAETSTEDFIRVMVTNALSPMRVIEALQHLVSPTGMIGVMSSGQGSITNNTKGGHEVYRGSKAALNQYMRCYAARHSGQARALLLLAPGWIRTELGGPNAPVSLEDAVPQVVDVLLAQQGEPGLRYVDREGRTVPW